MATISLPYLNPRDLEDVLLRVGFCLWQIQSFEYTFSQYLVFVHEYEPRMARSEVERVFEKTEKRTLGQMVARLKQKNPISEALFQQTEQFVEKRNWLVHRSRLQNHTDLYSTAKKTAFIKRIEGIADESLYLNKAYGAELERFFLSSGLTKERIDKLTQQLIDSWKF